MNDLQARYSENDFWAPDGDRKSGGQKSFSEYLAWRSFIYLNISKLSRFSNIKRLKVNEPTRKLCLATLCLRIYLLNLRVRRLGCISFQLLLIVILENYIHQAWRKGREQSKYDISDKQRMSKGFCLPVKSDHCCDPYFCGNCTQRFFWIYENKPVLF